MSGGLPGRFFGGVTLVIVLAFALAAVALLTSTLSAAHGIHQRVDVIKRRTAAIDRNTEAIRLTVHTAGLARRIYRQAAPLDGKLASVASSTVRIRRRVDGIRSSAGSIGARAAAIDRHVRTIQASSASIQGHAGSVRARTTSISGSLGGVHAHARSIDAGVAGINRRADLVMGAVGKIDRNLAATLFEVGLVLGHPYPPDATIHGHAYSIDCRLHLLLRPPPPPYCRRVPAE